MLLFSFLEGGGSKPAGSHEVQPGSAIGTMPANVVLRKWPAAIRGKSARCMNHSAVERLCWLAHVAPRHVTVYATEARCCCQAFNLAFG